MSASPGGTATQTETAGQTQLPLVCRSSWHVKLHPCSTLRSLVTVPRGISEAMADLKGPQGQLAGHWAKP